MTENVDTLSNPDSSPNSDDKLTLAIKNTLASIKEQTNNPEFMQDISVNKMLTFVSDTFQQDFPIKKFKNDDVINPVPIEDFLNTILKSSKLFGSQSGLIDLIDMEKFYKEMEKKGTLNISDSVDASIKNMNFVPNEFKGALSDMMKKMFIESEVSDVSETQDELPPSSP